MIADYEISLATPDDIPGILAVQEPNLPDSGGSLSVRQTADWFKHAVLEKSVVVGRRDGKVVGYVLGTSLAANAHIAIIQAMLRTFPAPPGCYLYGPVWAQLRCPLWVISGQTVPAQKPTFVRFGPKAD